MLMNINRLSNTINKLKDSKKARKNIPESIKIVGRGSRRIVIKNPENPNYIFKIAMWNGINHNKNEIKIFDKSKRKSISKYLCPIRNYDDDYKWVEMPYINNICDVSDKKITGPKSDQIHKMLASNGIKLYELETAIYKSDPVAYDYGQLTSTLP